MQIVTQRLRGLYRFWFNQCVNDENTSFLKSLILDKHEQYAYLEIPKAACSTVKFYLGQTQELIQEPISQYLLHQNLYWNCYGSRGFVETVGSGSNKVKVFTFVRNPFARILSAYREKIDLKIDSLKYRHDIGIAEQDTVSFEEFLTIIVNTDPIELDAHFRPQTLIIPRNILDDICVGAVENMDAGLIGVSRSILGVDVVLPSEARDEHSTQSSSMQNINKYYNDNCVEMVRSYYAQDFELLGYSDDISEVNQPCRRSLRNNEIKEMNLSSFLSRKVILDCKIRQILGF